jgi:hypothetical protein
MSLEHDGTAFTGLPLPADRVAAADILGIRAGALGKRRQGDGRQLPGVQKDIEFFGAH